MEQSDCIKTITIDDNEFNIFDINYLHKKNLADISRLPVTIKILVENLLRNYDGRIVTEKDLLNIARWEKKYDKPVEIPFHPARVLMQDFTGVPAIVDFAAMRDAVKELDGDPARINPLVPVDLAVDHSVQVDYYGSTTACAKNVDIEYRRNSERYALIKWAQKSFNNFSVVPPNSGICHQVNLEYIGSVVETGHANGTRIAFPDTLVGTDSHTTMINGIGVMGWGVGGIEAEAVMLGQPYYMSIPEVIGVKLKGKMDEGITATDVVLSITQLLREHNVVGKFVEFTGPGIKSLSVPDRATIANMAPEYGATLGFFPVDEKTIEYLKITNRGRRAEIVETYTRELGLFYDNGEIPDYTDIIEFDLSTAKPSIAGPARPQDRIPIDGIKDSFNEVLNGRYETQIDPKHLSNFLDESGGSLFREGSFEPACTLTPDFGLERNEIKIRDGSIVIAAITSCTNTSNPYVMIGAGLLAKKAVESGIHVSPYVKTSLVPGSKVVIGYLEKAGLLPYLEALGFHLAGYGCTTCIGNSGPLHPGLKEVIAEKNLTVAAVLSGNRNFEARINQHVRGNFLMSPMLVVAFALAGRIDIDFTKEHIGVDPNCDSVFLKDIWPTAKEINHLINKYVKPELYEKEYGMIFEGDEFWKKLPVARGTTFDWDEQSTYIKRPPYFENFSMKFSKPSNVEEARALLLLEDSVTTDHISPAGAISESYPAGRYLKDNGVEVSDFNSYGSRRGNHDVMIRGTFGNVRIKNKIIDNKEGSFTKKFPENSEMYIYDTAMKYKEEKTPLIVIAGKEYGTGSSRDWAAKGTHLLGVKAVIAESYERIHRSNLVGMSVLPLEFIEGDSWKNLGIDGSEKFNIDGINDIYSRKKLLVTALKQNGNQITFEVVSRLDTDIEVEYFNHGGILHYVLRKILKDS